nr:hypothetical protein Puna18p_00132 [Serratia proteamaculans]
MKPRAVNLQAGFSECSSNQGEIHSLNKAASAALYVMNNGNKFISYN